LLGAIRKNNHISHSPKQHHTQLSKKYILEGSLINRRRRGREDFPLTAHARPRAHSPVTGVACSPVERGSTDITGGQHSGGQDTLNRVTPKILALEEILNKYNLIVRVKIRNKTVQNIFLLLIFCGPHC
jgi:hypothetical protein